MKSTFTLLFAFLFSLGMAQTEYHVFPIDHDKSPGKSAGNGTLNQPWDLQTALSKKELVKPGDIIWLHEGQYNGRFNSTLTTGNANGHITISGYKNKKVILNGNVPSSNKAVLDVTGNGVIFKNFEVTFLGNFPRKDSDPGFKPISGIEHRQGANCKFINIKIHNVPGSGIGSWKRTSNTQITNCIIYNNGYIGARRGHGVGIYVQNESDAQRVIKGNIIFSNYYKGIQVWSASNGGGSQFVKNVILKDNVIFNSGLPSGQLKDNLIVATGDGSGKHIAKNITVEDNVFYHNTDIKNGQIINGGMSITLGFNRNAPVKNIKVNNNVIVGGKNGLRIMHVEGLEFKNNTVYSEFVRLNPGFLKKENNFDFSNNKYFTRRNTPFRIAKTRDYTLRDWQKELNLDAQSTAKVSKEFKTQSVLKFLQVEGKQNEFLINILDPESRKVLIDFSNFSKVKGQDFKIYNIENPNQIFKSGRLSDDLKIIIDLTEADVINASEYKSLSNFGVFRIVFNDIKTTSVIEESKQGFFAKLFKRLGF